MAKPKAKTLQERFGFVDDDLKRPMHDEIMQWIDRNAEDIINDLFYKDWAEERNKFEGIILNRIPEVIKDRQVSIASYFASIQRTQDPVETEQFKERIAGEEAKINHLQSWKGFADPQVKPRLKVTKKEWEYTIKKISESKYSSSVSIIGFVDMKIDYEDYRLDLKECFIRESLDDGKSSFWDEKERKNRWDFSGNFQLSHSKEKHSIFIEAKSEIKSLGELIRQINVYRTYQGGNYFVVAPDDRYIDILNEQGIGFIKYGA